MARKPSPGPLPCLYCGEAFRDVLRLTAHLDTIHQGWVQKILTDLGLSCSEEYPIEEYRRSIAQAFAGGVPLPTN